MQRYIKIQETGVSSYEIGNDYIKVRFNDDRIYLYDYKIPGKKHIDTMKKLAQKGNGLCTYINKFIRKKYAAKLD